MATMNLIPNHAGSALSTTREALDANRLREELVSNGPCSFVDVVEETGSTNEDLAAKVTGKPKAGLAFGVLLAEHQTAGKGRMGRSFTAPPRSQLIVSIVVVPSAENLPRAGTLSLAAGLALVDTLGAESAAMLKWPNDLVISDKKMSGILAQGVDFGSDDPAVIMGIGLNVSLTKDELPVPHASSLLLQGMECDRTSLAIELVRNIVTRTEQWRKRHSELIADYKRTCATIGQDVRVHLPGGDVVQGVVLDVNEEGHVLVRPEGEGELREFAVGDIIHLRMKHQWQY